jgi:hypothetical protein
MTRRKKRLLIFIDVGITFSAKPAIDQDEGLGRSVRVHQGMQMQKWEYLELMTE